MTDAVNLAKAELHELSPDFVTPLDYKVTVQFNPESLKVSFANQLQPPPDASAGGGGNTRRGGRDQRGGASTQFVGAGTTKLTLQLWFDVNAEMPKGKQPVNDVRKLTQEVAYFITPKPKDNDPAKFIPPAVRFLWGSFQFDGIMDSMEETLEFFSEDGRPLRASVSFSLSQQKIQKFNINDTGAQPGTNRPSGAAPGTQKMTPASKGSTVPAMADKQGMGGDWQGIAAANGIENPRLLQPGQLLNLNVSTTASSLTDTLSATANISTPTIQFSARGNS